MGRRYRSQLARDIEKLKRLYHPPTKKRPPLARHELVMKDGSIIPLNPPMGVDRVKWMDDLVSGRLPESDQLRHAVQIKTTGRSKLMELSAAVMSQDDAEEAEFQAMLAEAEANLAEARRERGEGEATDGN